MDRDNPSTKELVSLVEVASDSVYRLSPDGLAQLTIDETYLQDKNIYPKIYVVFCDIAVNSDCIDFTTTNLDAHGLSYYQEFDMNVYTSFVIS